MTSSWALISPTELIAALADIDEDLDLVSGIDRMAETLDAEVAAICSPVDVIHAKGFGRDVPNEELLDAATSGETRATFAQLGELFVARSDLDGTDDILLFARTDDEFTTDELAFIRAIGRVVALSARMRSSLEAERGARRDLQQRVDDNRRLVGQLRERQGLLDRLFRIQRSISHRAPTQDVLDAVTIGALDLLGVGRVNLRLRDVERPDDLITVSSRGYDDDQLDRIRVSDVGEGITGRAIREERLVVVEPEGDEKGMLGDARAMMSAPVHVNGEVVGCLTVTSLVESRRFTAPEQEALLAFAEHASLALQDARAIDAMRNALNRERHRAEHDPLTGLPNRATIQHHLETRIADCDVNPLTVLFVDLDHFKLTNDTLGHAFGDLVLTAVADRLRLSVRDQDLVGRLAGDEFVVVCEGMTEVGAIELAERIQAVIGQPVADGAKDHVITASVGIAGAISSDTAEQLIANADLAMYRAKQSGRSRIEVFDLEFRNALEERLVVGRDLRRALHEGEFVVHLQPVVRLPERRVVGFESLARWRHPERGLIFPDGFIALAEDTGLIGDVDRAVVDESLRLLGASDIRRPVAVNLSARTFADASLVDWLDDRLAHHGVDPGNLVVEVTETVLMESTGAAARQLEAIRSLGISVMIDDFGTGYSSLAYLQTFDVDGVKIDRSFTQLLGEDPRASAIVSAVLHMADALDLAVVVEGVERDEQVDHVLGLRDRTADVVLHAQGYLFGRPEDGAQRLAGFVEVPSSASAASG
ncbi:MAG: EAL domain-containing protein [Actinomycetota bacterium]